jgi:hypothetical protein
MTRESSSCRLWPDNAPTTGASYNRVDTGVSCILTRFQVNSPLSIIRFYLAFRRVRRAATKVTGLLKTVFLVEDTHTCYTLSLWRDEWSIVNFGLIHAHVEAARFAFPLVRGTGLGAPEIWSAQFRLWATSPHNLNWRGLDLRAETAVESNRSQTTQESVMRHDD